MLRENHNNKKSMCVNYTTVQCTKRQGYIPHGKTRKWQDIFVTYITLLRHTVLPVKLSVGHLIKKFRALYGTSKLITEFTRKGKGTVHPITGHEGPQVE